jgi:hypothetical protein
MDQLSWVKCLFNIGMKKLLNAVNPGIGSTAPDNLDFSAEQFAENALHNSLNPRSIGLALPTRIVGSVITYFEEVPHPQ